MLNGIIFYLLTLMSGFPMWIGDAVARWLAGAYLDFLQMTGRDKVKKKSTGTEDNITVTGDGKVVIGRA